MLLRRRLRVPVVVSEHLSSFVDGSLGRPQQALARQVFERADLVCPVSDDLAGRLAALAPRARLQVVSNVVDTDLFHPPAARHGGPARLAVVAGLHPRKGVDHLLRALVRVREETPAVLEVAGDGPARTDLETLADRLGIGTEVEFLGIQDRTGVAALMRRADLLVVPSLAENQPVVLLEAQASGLPVVASDVGGVREVVDAFAGRLVPSGDVDALAGAIKAVLAAPGHYDRSMIATRARERYGRKPLQRAGTPSTTSWSRRGAPLGPMPRGDLALSSAPVLRAKEALTRARSFRWRLWPGQAEPGLRIIFYHRVADEPDELAVSPRRFAAHMNRLADDGLVALDVEEAVARHAEGHGAGVIGLCFDDGYADVADHALPVLQRHGFSATVFLPTGIIDGTAALSWYDHPSPMLSWEQVRTFDRAGTLRFGRIPSPIPT